MKRITGLKFCALGLIPMMSNTLEAKAKYDTQKMNILLITTEDWSAKSVGCYGNSVVKTPYMDALAKKGIKFNRCYVQGTVSNPSRASLMTGMRPDATKIYGNDDDLDELMSDTLPFIATELKKKGAYMAQSGKLPHKWKWAQKWVNTFDEMGMEKPFADTNGKYIDLEEPFIGFKNKIREYVPPVGTAPIPKRTWEWVPDTAIDNRISNLINIYHNKLKAGDPDTWEIRKPYQQLQAEQLGDVGFAEEHYQDGILARIAENMINDFSKDKKQFFLHVGLYGTHTPLLAPKKYVDMYKWQDMQLPVEGHEKDVDIPKIARRNGQNFDIFNGYYPEYQATPDNQKKAIAAYYACSSYIDAQIGYILNALKKAKLDQNTIVVVFGDHGFHLGEHGMWSKFSIFEESTRIPFIVYVPGAKGNGKACNEFVELVDLLPTFCDLWGIEKDKRYEGISFSPLLSNPELAWKKAIFSTVPLYGLGRSVRTKDYRYSEYRKTKGLATSNDSIYAYELYNLKNDPSEHINLANKPEYTAIQKEMQDLLKAGWKAALPSKN